MIESAPTPRFGERFPDPVIGTLGTFPGGIELVSVYDRSQQAEDPLVPELWLVLESGDRVPQGTAGIELALQQSGFVVTTEEEAWALIRLALHPRSGSSSRILLDPSGLPGAQLPHGVLRPDQAWSPAITRTSDGFTGELLEYRTNTTPRFFGRPVQEDLIERRFRLGPGRFEQRSFELWTRGGPQLVSASGAVDPQGLAEGELLERLFEPAPSSATLVLAPRSVEPVIVEGRYARFAWVSTTLEESDLGSAFNVVVHEQTRNVMETLTITSGSRPVVIGDFIVVGRIENGNAFHREPETMRLILQVFDAPTFLLRALIVNSPPIDVIIRESSTRTPLELLSDLSPAQTHAALLRLRTIPGLGRDGTISDTETFHRVFDWIRADIPRETVRAWFEARGLAHPAYDRWVAGPEPD